MTIYSATMQKDVYKEFHGRAYHPQVTQVYSNYTSRNGRLSNIKDNQKVGFVGLQYFIQDYLISEWNDTFFNLPKNLAVKNHKRVLSSILGYPVSVKYLEDLHDLGHLPIHIKALPEGTMVPYGVPPITIVNTHDNFAWLTNMIETVMSCENWPMQTSFTTAIEYCRVFRKYAKATGLPLEMVPFQGHDFSFRGMFGRQAAAMSGFAHLASGFVGTDTIPAVLFAEKYYAANVDKELVGASVDATEHSVTCSWLLEGELEFFRYLMREQSPTGILSVVSDTWDFWKVVTEIIPLLKKEIMERDGTLVIRPDSGDPVLILCGYKLSPNKDRSVNKRPLQRQAKIARANGYEAITYGEKVVSVVEGEEGRELMNFELKGLIECLWDTFGGTITAEGYKLLDDHIGAIYGDAITLARQEQILSRLMDKGFASKVVLGIGSYSYTYVTRDSHGSAVKATNVVKNGENVAIFKDPKTDKKKRSAKGLIKVHLDDNGELTYTDEVTMEQEKEGLLEDVFIDGKLLRHTSLAQIRALVEQQINNDAPMTNQVLSKKTDVA